MQGFQAGNIDAMRRELAVCLTATGDLHVKSCRVAFSDDGSLHIALPHFRHLTGIICASYVRAWERATLSQVKSAFGRDIGRLNMQPVG